MLYWFYSWLYALDAERLKRVDTDFLLSYWVAQAPKSWRHKCQNFSRSGSKA